MPVSALDRAAVAYVLDSSRWPLAVARPTSAVDDPAALDRSYAELEALLARDQRFVSMFDIRGTRSSAARRRRLAQWIESRQMQLKRLCIAHAALVDTTFERGLVTAYLWLARPFVPFRAFDDEAEATAWLLSMYAQAERH
jgi:hypothetical protein